MQPSLIERPGENALKNRQNNDCRCKQTDDGKGCCPRCQRKGASEDQKFPDETIQTRQTQRGKQCDTHQATEDWSDFAQASEIIEPAQTSAAFLQQSHKPKQRRGSQTMVEHLQHHAVERGYFVCCQCSVSSGESRN